MCQREEQDIQTGFFIQTADKDLKGPLSCLRQFLATESPLKMMKNVFYFNLKALFVLKVFKFLSGLFSYVGNQLDKLDKVNFKTYDVAN